MVVGFIGNYEQYLTSGGGNDSLAWKIIVLAFEDKLQEMISLRKHIKWKIGLPESNFISLFEEIFFQPKVQFEEIECAL